VAFGKRRDAGLPATYESGGFFVRTLPTFIEGTSGQKKYQRKFRGRALQR
jgi:hypothetical protein